MKSKKSKSLAGVGSKPTPRKRAVKKPSVKKVSI
jgi:hypothetical protein